MLTVEEALELSTLLRRMATSVLGNGAGSESAGIIAARSEAVTLLHRTVVAVGSGEQLEPSIADSLNQQLAGLMANHDAALFDPEVGLVWEAPRADVDAIDYLTEIVVTMTAATHLQVAGLDMSSDRSAILAYTAVLLISVASLGWFAYAERVGRRHEFDRLRHAAGHDELTGLPNRSQLHHVYTTLRPRRNRPIGVIYIDLDRFKPINDSFGHHVGDEVLRRVAHRLREVVRRNDVVARLGGDEFAVLVTGARTEGEILSIAHRVIEALNSPMTIEGNLVDLGASGGAAIVTDTSTELSTALRDADAALFAAKKAGRGRLLVSPAMAE